MYSVMRICAFADEAKHSNSVANEAHKRPKKIVMGSSVDRRRRARTAAGEARVFPEQMTVALQVE
jgi:hypothetical protein